MTETNRQVRLRRRPEGIPEARHFEVTEEPLGPLVEGRFRIRNAYLSVDPAMRGWVSAVANYSEPVGIGEVMRSLAVGQVVESRHPDYAPGERLMGMFGWQHFADAEGRDVVRRVPSWCESAPKRDPPESPAYAFEKTRDFGAWVDPDRRRSRSTYHPNSLCAPVP
jgi:NADPH-dependent curcumin reductase CurA